MDGEGIGPKPGIGGIIPCGGGMAPGIGGPPNGGILKPGAAIKGMLPTPVGLLNMPGKGEALVLFAGFAVGLVLAFGTAIAASALDFFF